MEPPVQTRCAVCAELVWRDSPVESRYSRGFIPSARVYRRGLGTGYGCPMPFDVFPSGVSALHGRDQEITTARSRSGKPGYTPMERNFS